MYKVVAMCSSIGLMLLLSVSVAQERKADLGDVLHFSVLALVAHGAEEPARHPVLAKPEVEAVSVADEEDFAASFADRLEVVAHLSHLHGFLLWFHYRLVVGFPINHRKGLFLFVL